MSLEGSDVPGGEPCPCRGAMSLQVLGWKPFHSADAIRFPSRQVLVTLDHLERVSTFQEFVQIFSQFGNEMVEFAHLTGDRQNVSEPPRRAPPSSSVLTSSA